MPKENRKSTRCFRGAGGTNQGLLAPGDPKEEGFKQKCWRFVHSHEDLLTAFSLSADLLLRSRLYALAERKVLLKRNTLGEAVNRRSEKNAFSEAASIFPLRLLLRGLKGASSPFLATATTAACGGNREELLGPRSAGHECRPRHEVDAGYRNPSDPARRNRWCFSGSLLARKRERSLKEEEPSL